MLFVGIDLAWSTKNGSGISVIDADSKSGKLGGFTLAYSDDEIINYIREKVGTQNAIIAIDAPLIVPNEEGRRVAEAITGTLFRKYDAGAHPSNRKRLSSWGGKIRGEELSKRLEAEGFLHQPEIKKLEEKRAFFEVYPHPSMVVLFKLSRILRYKAKPKRDYEFRYAEFDKYLSCLKNLKKSDANLILPDEIINKNIRELKAQKLKDHEDLLDSIFCAYIAYYYWKNPDKCAILGSMKEGYILTPIFDHMHLQLKQMEGQKSIADFSKTL